MKPTALLKINIGLLVVVVIALGACLYLLFMNKQSNNRQENALAVILKKFLGEDELKTEAAIPKEEIPENTDPTDADWEKIYSISEKLYNNKALNASEKSFYKKFEEQILNDIEFCKQFYPVVEKFMNGEELAEDDKAFYEANQEDVDAEVNYRKSQAPSPSPSRSALAEQGKSQDQSNSQEQTTSSPTHQPSADLHKANPPTAIEDRNKLILSFFADGVPKTVKQLNDLYKTATGKDYGKNFHRLIEKLGNSVAIYKRNNIHYYCLTEWFVNRKLEQKYKDRIA